VASLVAVGDMSGARDPLSLVRVDVARLEAAIEASGISFRRVAQRAGIDLRNLRRVRQRGSAAWFTVRRVAEVLNVDPAALLADEPTP
jgi:hypothetical protein